MIGDIVLCLFPLIGIELRGNATSRGGLLKLQTVSDRLTDTAQQSCGVLHSVTSEADFKVRLARAGWTEKQEEEVEEDGDIAAGAAAE